MIDKLKNIRPLYKGIVLIVLSAFFFALMNMFVQLSGNLPSLQKSFFRNFVAFLFAGIILVRDGERIQIPANAVLPLILRASFGTAGVLCNFYALGQLDLADASILNKMSPFFAIIFSVILLKEKIKPVQIIIVAAAFAGAMLVVKPSFANADTVPAFAGLFGGMCAGIAYTFVRMLGQRNVKGAVIVFFFSVIIGREIYAVRVIILLLSLIGASYLRRVVKKGALGDLFSVILYACLYWMMF